MFSLFHTAILAPMVLASGCAFNVALVDVSATGDFPGASYSTVRVAPDNGLSLERLEIHGTTDPDIHAIADVSMLLPAGQRPAASPCQISFLPSGSSVSPTLSMTRAENEDPPRIHSFVVAVPSRYAVDVRHDAAAIVVDGVTGDVHVQTQSGSVDVQTEGAAMLSTSSGSITARAASAIESHSVSGSISATASGGVVSTTSGSLAIDWRGTTIVPLSLTAVSGSVDVRLPASLGFHLHAQSTSGSISVDGLGVPSNMSTHTVDADVNGGGPLLQIETVSGSIAVAAQ